MRKSEAIQAIEKWCADHKGAFDTIEMYNIVCKAFEVDSITDSTRKRDLSEARKCYVWFCYMLMKVVHPATVARRIGKSRPAVSNSFAATRRLLEVDDALMVANIQKVFTQIKLQYERVQSKV